MILTLPTTLPTIASRSIQSPESTSGSKIPLKMLQVCTLTFSKPCSSGNSIFVLFDIIAYSWQENEIVKPLGHSGVQITCKYSSGRAHGAGDHPSGSVKYKTSSQLRSDG